MLSKAKIKQIKALGIKKFRDEQGLFVAEGDKIVSCLLPSFECEWVMASERWKGGMHERANARTGERGECTNARTGEGKKGGTDLIVVEADELRKVSFLKTPQEVLAVFRKPRYAIEEANPALQLVLALDGIQDPGNLGTIIRIAEWFGIEHIICSLDTADAFSPKTVQATMGALANVKVLYSNLKEYILKNNASPVYGTFLEGENIFQSALSQKGVIVMGNEGNGIRPEIEALINKKLYIPSYPPDCKTTGSLNVATATAIVCAEFRRKTHSPPVIVHFFCISSAGCHSGKYDERRHRIRSGKRIRIYVLRLKNLLYGRPLHNSRLL